MKIKIAVATFVIAVGSFTIGHVLAQAGKKLDEKTAKNLSSAMHGEALAYANYLLFAQHARRAMLHGVSSVRREEVQRHVSPIAGFGFIELKYRHQRHCRNNELAEVRYFLNKTGEGSSLFDTYPRVTILVNPRTCICSWSRSDNLYTVNPSSATPPDAR